MFNPFLFPRRSEKPRRKLTVATEEAIGQMHGRAVEPDDQPDLGLWLGRVLIRIGEKLARQDVELKHAREHA